MTDFYLFRTMFFMVFLLTLGIIALNIFRSVTRWSKNNASPKLTVDATVAAKRTDISRHRGANDHHHTTTRYYATFQVESGDRLELKLTGQEYGMLVEGDRGRLTFQGTRYLGFQRT